MWRQSVFEHSRACWAYVIHRASQRSYEAGEEFVTTSLVCPLTRKRLVAPVTIPGVKQALSTEAVVAAIAAGTSIVGCTATPLTAEHMVPQPWLQRLVRMTPASQDEARVWSRSLGEGQHGLAHVVVAATDAGVEGGSVGDGSGPVVAVASSAASGSSHVDGEGASRRICSDALSPGVSFYRGCVISRLFCCSDRGRRSAISMLWTVRVLCGGLGCVRRSARQRCVQVPECGCSTGSAVSDRSATTLDD